ncbi:MAG: hypothetical protein KatS3mg062_1401 [Tepidiforma sp.]|nr:MAG: hypothetical protein KatS3mg062_1401 [Tepidiforma sp.]
MPSGGGAIGGILAPEAFDERHLGDEHRDDGAAFGEQTVGSEEALGGEHPEGIVGLEGVDDGGHDGGEGERDACGGGAGGRRGAVFAGDFSGAGVEVFDKVELLPDGEARCAGGIAGDGDLERLAGGGGTGKLALENGDMGFVAGHRLELADRRQRRDGFTGGREEEAGANEHPRFAGGEPADTLGDARFDGLAEVRALRGGEGDRCEADAVAGGFAEAVADCEGEAKVGHGAGVDRSGSEKRGGHEHAETEHREKSPVGDAPVGKDAPRRKRCPHRENCTRGTGGWRAGFAASIQVG